MLRVVVQICQVCELFQLLAACLSSTSESQSKNEGLVTLVNLVEPSETAAGTVFQDYVWEASVTDEALTVGALSPGKLHDVLALPANARFSHQFGH